MECLLLSGCCPSMNMAHLPCVMLIFHSMVPQRNTVARLHPTAESATVATVKLLHVYSISLCVQRQDCPTSKSSDIYLNSIYYICSQNPSSYKQSFSSNQLYKSLIIPSKPIKNSIENVLKTHYKTKKSQDFCCVTSPLFHPSPTSSHIRVFFAQGSAALAVGTEGFLSKPEVK